jgi:UDP-2,3-diacylglucosamine pyrophosphatase LpxH
MEKIKTLFISDVHLGSSKSSPDKLLSVFRKYEFENLVIVGDFIDLTSLKKKFFWNQDHSTVLQKVLRFSRKGVKVTYIIGNHDFYVRGVLEQQKDSINFGDIQICDEITYTTQKGEKIFICHGDQFDGFIRLHPFLYVLGDKAYEFSFQINKVYNFFRKMFGFNYWSLSSYLKAKVKSAVSFINDFQRLALDKAKQENVDSIMIGHIHTPAIEKMDDKTYYNTGDFCETCSYLVETTNGEIELRYA